MIKLYNTLTRKIELFEPITKGRVKLYSCGPTVYNFVHLGNLRAYIFVDLLKRYLKYCGFRVKHIMNITDVDDKTIKNSLAQNIKFKNFTNFYTKAFIKDAKSLNIQIPDILPRATKHIDEIVAMVKKLEKKGYAYRSSGSIYFKIAKFASYGELAGLEKQSLKQNADLRLNSNDEYEKDEINDFVLWKAWTKQDKNIFWNTEIGKGRPGWHIECSAMSMKYLGTTFDIHTGGVDLIFPHHTNEIAQSEAVTGKRFVNFWLHNAHLLVDGRKMSKSFNNFYTLKDIIDKGYNPLIVRLSLLKSHYRQNFNFTFEGLGADRAAAEKFLNFLLDMDFVRNKHKNEIDIEYQIAQCRDKFKMCLDDDLNISSALATIFDFMNEVNRDIEKLNFGQARKIKKYIFEIDSVLGFIKPLYEEYQNRLAKLTSNKKIKTLIDERMKLRVGKDFKKSDEIRNKLLTKGVVIIDTENGYRIRLSRLI